MRWDRVLRLLTPVCCWLLMACGTAPDDAPQTVGPKALGERCEKTEDCASLLCVSLDETSGVCSQTCRDDQGCPSSDNWGCLPVPALSFSVCGCLPLADSEVCGDRIDNDCNAKVDDCRICDGRPVPSDDHDHCGSCDRACRSDQACDSAECACQEPTPDDCGGRCTSVATDPSNCGACGTACGPEQVCQTGACVCPDAAQPDYCPGEGCLDLSQDDNHCGSCGEVCDQGRECAAGSCVCPSAGPPDFCDGVGCLDLQTSFFNCGECGRTCLSGQLCSAGECACPAGQSLCDEQCVNLQGDNTNCGECGEACPTAQACIEGACGCSAVGYSVCGDACVNVSNDEQHCGECGNPCGEGEVCSFGDCGCPSGVYCDTTCMPPDDEQNCGTCGHACPSGQYCSTDSCWCLGFGLSECGDECFDLDADEQNCGACGHACRTGEVCGYGLCACPYGETYCESAGKCVPLATDAANCGTCGQACEATEVCKGGVCGCSVTGQLYCAAEGACTDTQSHTEHCGDCATRCKPTEVCSQGACQCPGFSEQFCASENACMDLWTDGDHCGACDKACPAQTHCSYGSCACDTVGETLCGSECFDMKTDADHCGACDNDCGGNYICAGSKCVCPQPTVGTMVRLTDNTVSDRRPVAAWSGSHVGVAYLRLISANDNYYNLRFALLDPTGTVVKDVAITSYTAGQYQGAIDTPGITWNGSEYAVVWVNQDLSSTIQNGTSMRMVRITSTGVVGATVIVADIASFFGGHGATVAWSTPMNEYAVGGSLGNAYFRRVGAQGTTLQAPNNYAAYGNCLPSLAVSPTGSWGLSCEGADQAKLGIFNSDGSRTLEPVGLGFPTLPQMDSETIWDGSTFTTVALDYNRNIRLHRYGSTALSFTLVAEGVGGSHTSVEIVGQSGVLALGYVSTKLFRVQRFTLPAVLETTPSTFHNPVDIVSTANVIDQAELVSAGASKLLAIWVDDRWGGTNSELYAAPIDLKSCP